MVPTTENHDGMECHLPFVSVLEHGADGYTAEYCTIVVSESKEMRALTCYWIHSLTCIRTPPTPTPTSVCKQPSKSARRKKILVPSWSQPWPNLLGCSVYRCSIVHSMYVHTVVGICCKDRETMAYNEAVVCAHINLIPASKPASTVQSPAGSAQH